MARADAVVGFCPTSGVEVMVAIWAPLPALALGLAEAPPPPERLPEEVAETKCDPEAVPAAGGDDGDGTGTPPAVATTSEPFFAFRSLFLFT